MITFTGFQYLLIDAATQFGLDKLTFPERIKWTEANMDQLESLASEAETKPLYMKAVLAIRKAQKGLPTGHMVGVDGCCSGVQVMSVLTGCVAGATATGLVDPDRRADAYTDTTTVMNRVLKEDDLEVTVERKDAKRALMTSFYGSEAVPEDVFGEDTPELKAFYEAAMEIAPGAWDLLQTLKAAWNPYALFHAWKLPDGYDAHVRVLTRKEIRIEVDELDHASFTYEYYENKGTKKGISLPANVTHSVDAYILREMHRRCNYDREQMEWVAQIIEAEMVSRSLKGYSGTTQEASDAFLYYQEQYQRSTLASSVILPYIDDISVQYLSDEHLSKLAEIVNGMLQYKSFPLVTVHDEFKAHPNNVNWVRWNYKEILADIADSDVLTDLLNQIHGEVGTYDKLSFNLGDLIRNSNYGLC